MSYTSKYTGPEIDSLLSSIGGINATKKVLWEGQLGGTDANATLSDSIFNYDFISVEAQITDNTGSHGAAASVLISIDEIEDFNDRGFSIFTSADPSKHWYRVSFTFTNGNVIHLARSNVSSNLWINPHIYKVVGIKFAQSSLAGGSASNPIGSIIPVMGKEAPQDYLVCDGSELNISEYGALANYFEKQFGTKNHFGGDGVNTFAIPDLRDEFLRGYKGDNERQLSGEIGEHQDATSIPQTILAGNGLYYYHGDYSGLSEVEQSNNWLLPMDSDEVVGGSSQSKTTQFLGTIKDNPDGVAKVTTRPTNVAVLFCIKYTESASGNGGSSLGKAFLEYNFTANGNNIPIDSYLPLTSKLVKKVDLDSEGNPVLKAGKVYKVTLNIYRCNIPDSTTGCMYMSMTTDVNNSLRLVSAAHPVSRSKNYQMQNVLHYTDVLMPDEDFSLKLIAKHAEMDLVSAGITLLNFNLIVEELA